MIDLHRLRDAQLRWAEVPLRGRLRRLRTFRSLVAENASDLAKTSADARGRPFEESLTAEVLPLAEACKFLEKNAPRLLRTRRFGARGLPLWLRGVRSEVRREPCGVILIIGPGNYPLFLPGVQMIQALAAGNAVMLKPGRGGSLAAQALVELAERAGINPALIQLLPETVDAANDAIDAQPDKVIFTGSAEVAEIILARLAPRMIPAVIEASGCDAVLVRKDADLDLTAEAITFALALNHGNTCMVPQRFFAHQEVADDLQRRLAKFVPEAKIERFSSDEEAVQRINDCQFGLGASIFTRCEKSARELAKHLTVGLVTINDIIVSSADPRLPFGGRRRSGFGTTRGEAGLLEMTFVKAVTVSRSRFRPAYQPVTSRMISGILTYARIAHGTGLRRFRQIKSS